MTETNSHSEIVAAATKCFADDGNLDLGELTAHAALRPRAVMLFFIT